MCSVVLSFSPSPPPDLWIAELTYCKAVLLHIPPSKISRELEVPLWKQFYVAPSLILTILKVSILFFFLRFIRGSKIWLGVIVFKRSFLLVNEILSILSIPLLCRYLPFFSLSSFPSSSFLSQPYICCLTFRYLKLKLYTVCPKSPILAP